jgi:Na+-translocating ferredoxin:NAD+ oxidoreductase subunit D
MKFAYRVSPNAHDQDSTQRVMGELSLALLVVFAFGVGRYFFMADVKEPMTMLVQGLLMLLTSCTVAIVSEVLWALFVVKVPPVEFVRSSFPLVTAIILTLMCPINMPLYALGVATFFAIVFGKLLFGGFGHNVFNPAAVGRAMIFASFATASVANIVTGATPTSTMAGYNWVITNSDLLKGFLGQFGGLSNLFLGLYHSALGESSTLLLVLIGVWLAVRKIIDWRVPVFYVGTVFSLALVVMLVQGLDWWYPIFHVLTGGLMFGAVFMATDPVTNPTSNAGRIIFAIGCGIITVLIRIKGNLPEGVLYSILMMNMLTPLIERATDGKSFLITKKNAIIAVSTALVGVIVVGGIGTTLEAKDPTPKPEPKPQITLKKVDFNDEVLAKYTATIIETREDGTDKIYVIEVKGYAILGEESHGDPIPNTIEVTIDADLSVDAVKVITFSDSKGIGDKIKEEDYLKALVGLKLDASEADAATGATISSRSVLSAVRAALKAAAKK